jgi:hypothetical protein
MVHEFIEAVFIEAVFIEAVERVIQTVGIIFLVAPP